MGPSSGLWWKKGQSSYGGIPDVEGPGIQEELCSQLESEELEGLRTPALEVRERPPAAAAGDGRWNFLVPPVP